MALRTYGTLLATRADVTIRSVVEELSKITALSWLEEEGNEPTGARRSFEWSYRRLSSERTKMLRALGLHPGPEVSIHAAAVAAGVNTILPGGSVLCFVITFTYARVLRNGCT
jgi:hypothetical protein